MRKLLVLFGLLAALITIQAFTAWVVLPALSAPAALTASVFELLPWLVALIPVIIGAVLAFLCVLSIFLFIGVIATFTIAALITVPASGR